MKTNFIKLIQTCSSVNLLSSFSPTNFFWSSHANNETRRSFLMVEIRNNYSQLDLNSLNKGSEDEFEQIKSLTEESAKKKKKVKVKSEK